MRLFCWALLITFNMACSGGLKPAVNSSSNSRTGTTSGTTTGGTTGGTTGTTTGGTTGGTTGTTTGGTTGGTTGTTTGGTTGGTTGTTTGGTTTGTLPQSLTPWDSGATYTSTVYVSPTGMDSNPGTQSQPFQTVARALQGAGPGRDVVLLAGNYPALGSLTNLTGTQTNPIRIRGSGTVNISSTGQNTVVLLRDPRYVVIENITFNSPGMHAMNIDDGGTYDSPGDYLVLRNLRILVGSPSGNIDCVKMSGINHFYVTGSEFTGCGSGGEGIDMVGCHNGVVTGNNFHDIRYMGIQTKGGSSDVLIHGNIFRNIGLTSAGGHALQLGGGTDGTLVRPLDAPYEAERIQAIGNVIENSQFAAVAFVASNDVVVAHNTIINPLGRITRILVSGRDYPDGTVVSIGARNGRFENNIIYYSGNVTLVNVGVDTFPATFVYGNNLYYNTSNPSAAAPTVSGGVPAEQSSRTGNPMFVNASARDYHLQSGSAARGMANPMPSQFYYFDLSQIVAPQSAGAFP